VALKSKSGSILTWAWYQKGEQTLGKGKTSKVGSIILGCLDSKGYVRCRLDNDLFHSRTVLPCRTLPHHRIVLLQIQQ